MKFSRKQSIFSIMSSALLCAIVAHDSVRAENIHNSDAYSDSSNQWSGIYAGVQMGYAGGNSEYVVPSTSFSFDVEPSGLSGGGTLRI